MKITIPKPCHENWNAMTPDEKGRFCAVCSKTVRDFRRAPDDEIIDVFAKASNEICGSFLPSQLNRDLHYSYINALFVKFAVGFMLTTGGIISVNAQQKTANDTLKTEDIKEITLTEFGIHKDRKLLGSVSVVPADALACKEKKSKTSASNLAQPLTTQVSPNVVQSISSVRIGGVPSSKARPYNPLYVVDGKISDYEKVKALDPNMIKTMNVLKGASAKYGEKAKDGVIVITTKRKKYKTN
ncbi:outer membrane receptor protein involved in Fe transport [Chryseobacterium vietnamense]|jgi:outer membrane receptor protein involved in Fe transport|uniref:Outer membrane receptor protein involved in Fe transport n=1 Tax=Chryseobacterium vietnamense TaxID=866785 RepID=A0ACC6J6G1_9FLAO|nr:TonB-dependent receptor plug domain-containing protein [Chryseobacterium vietnamense]MDR6458646.1 outer membrane receptor protein involved in Fe transport [Chryseobacterium vietnamense]